MELKPVTLDENKLHELAEKYAIEGAEKAIKDYYTRYDSPYVKACTEHLQKMVPSHWFELPDLTAAINKALSEKIERLCDRIVANTYIEAFNRVFSGYEKDVIFSNEIYREYCEYVKDREDDDFEEGELAVKVETSSYGFKYMHFIYNGETEFKLHLMEYGHDKEGELLYAITSLPHTGKYAHLDGKMPMMRVQLAEGRTCEMPMTTNVLDCEFMAFIAKLLIHNVKVRLSEYHHWENTDE